MQLTSDTRIIVYGAGYCGAMFTELLLNNSIAPLCIFDKDKDKQKQTVFGIDVVEPYYERVDIVVVSVLTKGKVYLSICKYLLSLGYSENQIVHIYDLKKQKKIFSKQRLVIQPNEDMVKKLVEKFDWLESILADEESKLVLRCAMRFLQGDSDVNFPSHSIEQQYFAYDIYEKINNEAVVDCGGFKGDVMRIFLDNNNGKFLQYILIDPDYRYNEFIQQNIGEYDKNRIRIINKALLNRCDLVHITNYMNMNSVVSEVETSYSSDDVYATCLDDLLPNEKCTFLKIDIEGYEIEMLEGAKKFIGRNKPIIAVAVYHHENDLVNICKVILEHNLDYTLFLRSYMNYQEMVLYAIPQERLNRGE